MMKRMSLITAMVILQLCVPIRYAWSDGTVLDDFFAISYYWDINDLPLDQHVNNLKKCNINLKHRGGIKDLDYCQQNGIYCLVSGLINAHKKYSGEELNKVLIDHVKLYGDHPATFGYILGDEPLPVEFESLRYVVQKLKELDPEHISFNTLHPIYSEEGLGMFYEEYIDTYMEIVQPQMICYDNYTFFKDGTERNDYFRNMEAIRKCALKYDVPWWFALLSVAISLPDQDIYYRDPNEGELRWQVFTAITYGARGYKYFTYSSSDIPGWGDALMNRDLKTMNRKYYWAQQINGEVLTLAPILTRLTSTRVYHTSPRPSKTRRIKGRNLVTRVTGGPMVIGEFKDDVGVDYIFLTNRDFDSGRSYLIRLNKSITAISRIDKTNGSVVPIEISDKCISVSLSAGNGHLYLVGRSSGKGN